MRAPGTHVFGHGVDAGAQLGPQGLVEVGVDLPGDGAQALHLRVVVEDASAAIPQLLKWFEENQIGVEAVEEYQPPFDDVFVELIRREDIHA